jgi:hypothetical protein
VVVGAGGGEEGRIGVLLCGGADRRVK